MIRIVNKVYIMFVTKNSIFYKTNCTFQNRSEMLLEKKTGKLISTDGVDEKFYKKHKKNSVIAGAVAGFLSAEIANWKKKIPLGQKMLNRILFPVTGAAIFSFLAFQDIAMDKNFSTPQDKVFRYTNRGYVPQYKIENTKSSIKLSDVILAGVGLTLGVIHGLKGDKVKLPVMEWAYSNSKAVSAVVNGLGNALVYSVVGRLGLALIDKSKVNSTKTD